MRVNAYILAADPTWLRSSVSAYYPYVSRIVVSYDRNSRGWNGTTVEGTRCLDVLQELDVDKKMEFVAGDWVTPGDPSRGEKLQRQAALDLAGRDADWILQIDGDEVLPLPESLLEVLDKGDTKSVNAVEWPMRVLYRRLAPAKYLEVANDDGSIHVEYPGPIAVRPGSIIIDGRRCEGSYLRPYPTSADASLQLSGPMAPEERRVACLSTEDVIWHNSWGRPPIAVFQKVRAWGHTEGLRSLVYILRVWLPSPLTRPRLRDFHPFSRNLWPRLSKAPSLKGLVDARDEADLSNQRPSARGLAKVIAPSALIRLVRWRRDVWGDLRLRLLAEAGRLPSHRLRNAIYRRAGIALPRTSSIHWRAEFYAPERITIGEHTTIGDSVFLDGRSGLYIGRCVNLGSHVVVWTRQHDIDAQDFAEVGAPVTIENYAYVGSGSTILPGVRVGEGGVVGAGSVVTRDVEAYTLVAGAPARFVRKRSRDLDYTLGYAKRFV